MMLENQPVFDDLTDIYEAIIDWDKRLANEALFYRRLFDRAGVRSVLDTACGTGRHAAMLHSWGLRVEAADVSPKMIERARASFGEPDGLDWVVRGFDQPLPPEKTFDAAICVGNSLALALDLPTVERAVQEMLGAVRKGGLVVLHVLNAWHLPDGPCRWQKCKQVASDRGNVLILKGVHRCNASGYVDLVVASLDEPPEVRSESVPFLAIVAEELQEIVRKAGASHVELLGNYSGQPYDRQGSVDLIVVAEK